MIRITPEHIYLLRNATGRPFTDLLDLLIRTSASILGIPRSKVLDNPRVNHPDGGVDTEVADGVEPDPFGYLSERTVWQYKSVDLGSLSDEKVKAEISGRSKGYLRGRLREGYRYHFCVAHDGPPIRKTEIKALLEAEIRKVNPNAAEPVVLFAKDIVDWVNMFPAVAARMLGSSLTDFFHFATWQNCERAVTKTFVRTQESEVIFDSVRVHLDWKINSTTVRLTLSGDAGVGKSRTVCEAIATLPEFAPLTLYTDDESNALEIARALANYENLYMVLVADECLEQTAFHLASILQGVRHRVRLVTIDNARESSGIPELRLNRLPLLTVEKVVATNFPDIDPNRRYRYCNLADGYLRFAIFLCSNDGLIVQEGHLGQLLSDTKSYLSTLFGRNGAYEDDDFEAMMVISLVERCGVSSNLFRELEQLCALVGLDPRHVRERLHRMQKTNGLVARAGRYFYITPAPVAMVCFQAAWTRWAELDVRPFLTNFPSTLRPSFLARVARSPEEVGRVVSAYFQEWALTRGGDLFKSTDDTEQLLHLVRADPARMVPLLRDLILNLGPGMLNNQSAGRRKLVIESTEIAAFPEWFSFAEDILFTLACHETELGLGNNATKMWSGLFAIVSNVATPFVERLNKIQDRLQTGDPAARILCVEALRSALDERAIHVSLGLTYGHLIAPTPWHPKTRDEFFANVKACLSELSILSEDPDEEVREKATAALIASISDLTFRGQAHVAREGVGSLPPNLRPLLRAKLREFKLLNESEHSPHSPEQRQSRSESVREWIEQLASEDLHDRLVEEVGPDYWNHHLEQAAWQDRLSQVAAHLLQHENDFSHEIQWLSSDAARSSLAFGVQLGRIDEKLQFLDRITAGCRGSHNHNLFRGYVIGVAEIWRPQLPSPPAEDVYRKVNKIIDALWSENAILAFRVIAPCGDFVESFNRAIVGVRQKSIRAGLLYEFVAWNGPRHTQPTEVRVATETLLRAAREGDEDAANTGLEFIVFLLMRMPENEDKLLSLKKIYEDGSLTLIFDLLKESMMTTGTLSHGFSNIFILVLPINPQRATSILVQMLRSETYATSETAAGLLPSVGAICPNQLMDSVGEILLSDESNFAFRFRTLPIVSLPAHVLIDWLEKHGIQGARVLARFAPGPFMASHGPELNAVTRYILEKYGDDDIVFSSWMTGMNDGGMFTGSVAERLQQQASAARPFLTYPIAAVQRWARARITFADQNSESFRHWEEEIF